MRTEMDDPMVLEHGLATRAREMKEAMLKYGVFESSVGDSPASGAMEVAGQVVGMTPAEMMTEMDDPMVLESLLGAAVQPTWRCVQGGTPSEMRTDMDDPMVWESLLAARAREMKEALLKNGVSENAVVDSPASGAIEVPGQVVVMDTTPPALTESPVSDDMSKPEDRAQSEAAQEEDLALPMKPNEEGIAIGLPFKSSSFSSPNSGNSIDNSGEGTGVAHKKRKERGKNWAQMDTEDLLKAVSTTKKACARMEQSTDSDSYWDVIAKAVPGRTGDECRGRMDTLKRSFSKMKNYFDGQGDGQQQEFEQLKKEDFLKMQVSPLFTKEWYNQIRDSCPPKSKKKLKTNGAGSSSESSGFALDSSTLGLLPAGLDQGDPAFVWRLEYGVGIQRKEFVSTPYEGRSPSCDCNLSPTH